MLDRMIHFSSQVTMRVGWKILIKQAPIMEYCKEQNTCDARLQAQSMASRCQSFNSTEIVTTTVSVKRESYSLKIDLNIHIVNKTRNLRLMAM